MPVKLTQEQAKQNIKEYNNEYELISEYKTSKDPITLKHKCGHKYKPGRYKSFLEGKNKCPKCYPSQSNVGHSTKRITEEDLIKKIKDELGDEYTYISGFTKMDEKTSLIKHNTCEHEFLAAPKMMLGIKQTRCPICSNKNRGNYLRNDNYLEDILKDSIDGNEYKWLQEYNYDNKEKLEIIHITCNRTYNVRPNDFQQGYSCPHCSLEKRESYSIKFIKDILNKKKINFDEEKMFDDLKFKNNLKLDILLNDKNIIIEFDGQQHFSKKLAFTMENYSNTVQRDSVKNQWITSKKKYYFVRMPYNLNYEQIRIIIEELINKNKLSDKIIRDYNLYVYDNKEDLLYNSNLYYTGINKDYFIDNDMAVNKSI